MQARFGKAKDADKITDSNTDLALEDKNRVNSGESA